MYHWLVLVASAVCEAVWATALGDSDSFSKPLPTIVFLVFLALSMGGLAVAMRGIPVSVAYSVWVGVGAALTVTYAMLTGNETFSVVKLITLVVLVGSVVGLKFVGGSSGRKAEANSST